MQLLANPAGVVAESVQGSGAGLQLKFHGVGITSQKRSGDPLLTEFVLPGRTLGEVLLFSLAEDIGESRNLADAKPGKTEDLHAKLAAYLEAVNAEDWREIRKVQGKAARGLQIRRRIDSYLNQAGRDSAQEVEKRMGQLKEQLAKQNGIRRQSVRSQDPDANRAWARSNSECVFLREAIEGLQKRLRSMKAKGDRE
jgi:hypothetical protein